MDLFDIVFSRKVSNESSGVSKDYVDEKLNEKLDKTASAVSANKLSIARNIKLSSDDICDTSVLFDGTEDINLHPKVNRISEADIDALFQNSKEEIDV